MSWSDRLRPGIKLISPNGVTFSALWIGNERSKEKSLGRFKFPGIAGEYIQDLDFNASAYPLTIYFEGANHDIVSQSFWNECDANGRWTIIHPTKYKQTLQLSKVKENIQPVENGNITVFELEFFESLELYEIISGKQLSTIASVANLAFNAVAIAEFTGAVITESAAAVQTIKSLGRIIGNDIIASTKSITSGLPALRNELTGKQQALNNSIAGFDLDGIAKNISDLNQAGIQAYEQLVELQGVIMPLESMFAFIDSQLDGPIDNLPIVNNMRLNGDASAFNHAIICELAIGGALSSSAALIGQYEFKNRNDAIQAIDRLQTNFNRAINAIETVQGYFDGQLIKNQYVGYLRTYNNMREVFANSVKAILERIVSLPITKTYTLESQSSPFVEFAKTYTTGDIDALYDQFLTDNNFTGEKILYLPAGSEVVVYAR